MFNFGSKRKQNCLILTEDGRIEKATPPVVKGYAVDHKTMEAWLLPNNPIPEISTGKMFSVIFERDAAPFSIDGDNTRKLTEESIALIAGESADEALAQLEKKSFKNKMADTLRLVIIIFAITVVLIVIFGLISTGKLKMPSWGSIRF